MWKLGELLQEVNTHFQKDGFLKCLVLFVKHPVQRSLVNLGDGWLESPGV